MKRIKSLLSALFIMIFMGAMNLRLFDGEVGNEDIMTTGDLTPGMKVYYNQLIIRLVGPKLVHDQFAQKKPIPAHGGKTMEFRQYDPLPKALKPLVEGVTPKGRKYTMRTKTADIYQYGDYIPVTDILHLAHVDPQIEEATRLIGDQAGRTLDTVTREVLAGGTNVLYAGAVEGRQNLTEEDVLTPELIYRASTALAAKNTATIGGSYVCIIHPYAAYDIMRSEEWIEKKNYDTADYYNGELGKIGNVRFVQSTEAKIFKGEGLAEDSDTLTVSSLSGKVITFTGGTVAAGALEGRNILIENRVYTVAENTATTITVDDSVKGYVAPTSATVKQNDVIYPGEGGKEGCAVFGTLVLGANAYATSEITGGGLKHIFHGFGSGGVADALDQLATVGWKATKAVIRLTEDYMVRIESGSFYSDIAVAN